MVAVSLNVGTGDKYNGSINLNYRTPYFNFFTSYDSRIGNNENEGNTLRTNNINNTISYLDQENSGIFRMGSHNFGAGLDYLYDDFNTFTFSYRYRKFGFDSDGIVETSTKDSANALTDYFDRSNVADRNMSSDNFNLSYRRTFETKGEELTADVILSDHSMDRDEDIVQTNYDINLNPINEELQQGLSSNSNEQWTIQSNYINPIEGFW